MGKDLKAPTSLGDQLYFVLRYDRELEEYELALPKTDSTYMLGGADKARAYFKGVSQEYLGERAISAAFSFGAAQALIRQQRAFGLDLTDPALDKRGAHRDAVHLNERLLGAENDDDEVFVL